MKWSRVYSVVGCNPIPIPSERKVVRVCVGLHRESTIYAQKSTLHQHLFGPISADSVPQPPAHWPDMTKVVIWKRKR